MRIVAIVLASVLLAGCADVPLQTTAIEVSDGARYQADTVTCARAATDYRPTVTPAEVLMGGIGGMLDMLGYYLVYPLAPVLNGIGGAGNAALQALDPTHKARAKVFQNCVADKTDRDRSALIAKPGE